MEDSGWYVITQNFANVNNWGKGKGCDFVKKQCQSTT